MAEIEQEPSLFPQWRRAVKDFLAEFTYGALVPHDWLEMHFGMPDLADRQRMTAKDFAKRQFAWLSNIEAFKAELLREHQVCLQAVRGEGYRWVHPHEQTRVAREAFEKDARKVFATAAQRLRNVRLHELTDDQQRENIDAQAKLASLRGMTRKALR
jgi:hypothetical protein